MNKIRLANDSDVVAAAHIDPEQLPNHPHHNTSSATHEAEQAQLLRSSKIAQSVTAFLSLSLLVLWPMPMYGSGYVFSKKFFTGWVVVGILWLLFSFGSVGLYPLFEGRESMARTCRSIWMDVRGRGRLGRVEGVVGGGSEREEGSEGRENEKSAQTGLTT